MSILANARRWVDDYATWSGCTRPQAVHVLRHSLDPGAGGADIPDSSTHCPLCEAAMT
jgi:hypothetical protein